MIELVCLDADVAATVRMILVAGLVVAVSFGVAVWLRGVIEDR